MSKNLKIITVNCSYPEIEHLAAGLASEGLLSHHIRPYANKKRRWENILNKFSHCKKVCRYTIGRRMLVSELPIARVDERAIILDILKALTARIPKKYNFILEIDSFLAESRLCAIAQSGAKALTNEDAVVASWGVGESVFKKMKSRRGLCVLNYSFAHHAFAKKFLLEEAEIEPKFADTLGNCNFPKKQIERFDKEIDLADKILVGSSFVKNTFLSEGIPKEKLEILPYGVDTRFFIPSKSLSSNNKQFRVLFVGQISQRKGISYLLRAFKRFRYPGNILTLVGSFQSDRNTFAPWQNLFKHICNIPQQELVKIYQNNDVFLFPTLLEGMPLVILEAMSCGLPVITTLNGPGDIVRDGVDGYVVPTRDVDAIVDRLECLKNDLDLRIWMGRNARERALRFNWRVYRRKAVKNVQKWIRQCK